jgi:hypothetical protein
MSDSGLKTIAAVLNIAAIAVLALLFASYFGGVAPEYRGTLRNILLVLVLSTLIERYVRDKDNRARYRAYALWAVVISVPMVSLAFLRDHWQNPGFQSTFFPAVFGPVMIATMLGYVALAVLCFRSMRRAKQ